MAQRLRLRCSRFSSPHGLADDGRSCVRDLAALARAALAQRRIRRIAGSNLARFPFPVEGGYLDLYNNNPFIRMGIEGITGLKTGYTDVAGRCYVITRKRAGRHLGVVLLHSPNPLEQVPALLRTGVWQPRSGERQARTGSRGRRSPARGSRPPQVPLDATGRKRAKK